MGIKKWLAALFGSTSESKIAEEISDQDWLSMHLAAPVLESGSTARSGAVKSGHALVPKVPSDEDQLRFTGRTGRDNLLQAFEFYRFVRQQVMANGLIGPEDHILDFGCGWGRIARFWRRDVDTSRLWCVDCLTDAIDLLKCTEIQAQIVKNEPLPPVPGLSGSYRLIYAFSVFSHLSEATAHAWIKYFAGLLVPGGTLAITTRGRSYVEMLAHLRRSVPTDNHLHHLMTVAPPQDEIETKYAAGSYVFFSTGGGGELTEDFYGEAIIPPKYIQCFEQYGLTVSGIFEDVALVDQAVIVMRKPC